MKIDYPNYDRSRQQVQDTAQDEKRLPSHSDSMPLSLFVAICTVSGIFTLRYGYLFLRAGGHRLDKGSN